MNISDRCCPFVVFMLYSVDFVDQHRPMAQVTKLVDFVLLMVTIIDRCTCSALLRHSFSIAALHITKASALLVIVDKVTVCCVCEVGWALRWSCAHSDPCIMCIA